MRECKQHTECEGDRRERRRKTSFHIRMLCVRAFVALNLFPNEHTVQKKGVHTRTRNWIHMPYKSHETKKTNSRKNKRDYFQRMKEKRKYK